MQSNSSREKQPQLTEDAPTFPLLVEWNDTKVEYPFDKCIHQLFEEQVERSPDAIAVIFEGEQLTYKELNQRANRIAHHLKTLGVGPEVLVGICVERSPLMVVGLLGILKAGGAYVPLDPAYPCERLAFMLEDASVQVLLTQTRLVESLPKHLARFVCLDTDWETINQHNQENLTSDVIANNLAYVMYTSGSTGLPKGVSIIHRGVVRLVKGANYADLSAEQVFLQVAPISFDASTFEIWGCLLNGARLVIFPSSTPSLEQLGQAIGQYQITTLWLTAGLFHLMVDERLEDLKPLRQLLAGGDVLSVPHVQKFLLKRGECKLINGYGPTENTTFTCCYPLTEATQFSNSVPIGRPIANTQVYLLDEKLQPVPIGVPGELYIGGDGLARGYLNRPDLTDEKFIPNPWSNQPGSRLYKTGDKARYLSDGNIEFLGRIDNQVKIRGFRIELGEIEAALLQHPEVRDAVVIVREDTYGDKRLVAYIVSQSQISKAPATQGVIPLLRNFLQEKLPDYMVPNAFMLLDTLPLTPNGKVDRRNLPAPDRSRPDLEETFIAPRNPIEEKLAVIWAELLGLELIGVNDNFFYLGGHSLIAIQILSRVREVFTVELSFHQIFENPTIGSLAQLIQQGQGDQQWQRPAIERIPHEGLLPVSFAQERVYFIQQLAPESNAYQFQATLRFHGQLNIAVLQQCLNEIVLRHEIFRTTYPAVKGRLFQVIHPHQPISFTVIDLQSFPESSREAEVQRLVEAEVQKPLDLNQLPLVRWVLLKLNDQEHLLLHIEHHMVHDGWSFNVFLGELLELYQAFSLGNPSPLTEPLLQFADFAHWQRQWVKSQEAQAQLAYWQHKLSGSPPLLQLPLDRPRPTEQTYNGDQIRVELPIDLCESLRVLSRQEGVTLFMTMLATFLVMLHRYTGQDDLCVGTAVANRRMHEIEKLIGMIVNNLVLRTDLSGNPTFRELLARVRSCTLEAYANEDLPFDKVVEVLKPIRNLSHNPLFQVMFSFHDSPMPDLSLPGLDISLHEVISNKSAKFDLDFLVIPRFEQRVQNGSKTGAKGIILVLEYNSDLFDAATIQQMLEQYQKILIKLVANPEQNIGELPLLNQDEQQFLVKLNQNCREYSVKECIHKLFTEQVELTPNAIAVEQDGQRLTYRELSDRTNQLAHYLQSLAVKPETLVGICVDRSLEMIVGLLGILKAGGAYVPLDPAYPKQRLADILADTQLGILLTQERFRSQLLDYTGKTICLDTDWKVIAQNSTANPISDVQLNNLGYIIYTSGSTGKPKGVMIEHRSLLNFVMTATHEYGINATDRILQFASICFDTSIEEIFPCLCVGATLVLRTEEMLHSSDEFWRCCQQWQLTVLDLPTAYWHQLVTELNPQDGRIPASLKTLIIGGEEVQLEKVKHWHSCVAPIPHPPQLFNSYGPTEATVITTLHYLNSLAVTSVSIGRPISNAQVYVLDQYLQPVPVGVPGELHIGGVSLARGYWQRPELTAEKFIQNPIPYATCDRLYITGDLARYRADGTLEYLGRVDDQVKIRGFRIELGEIETMLRQHPQVHQAVVIARVDIPGQKRLVAYVVPQDSQPTTDELRHFLKQKLPNYMIPAAFVLLEALPMTPNRKVDYNALPTPEFSRSIEDKFVAPRTLAEEKLAAIWAEILRLEKVGIHENFFELGGDSIISLQIIARANQAGLQITTKQLFQYQTIADLAAVANLTISRKAEQGLVTGVVPLTPIQHWFFDQSWSKPNHFNQSKLLVVPPDLKPALLEQVVKELMVHHDALRMRFVLDKSGWLQRNTDICSPVPFQVIDLSAVPMEEQKASIERIAAEFQTTLNLVEGPLLRVVLFNLGKDCPSRLLLIIHHLVVDGVSWRILLEDIATAYQQLERTEAIQLPLKTTSFKDWAIKQKEYGLSPALELELDYWLVQSSSDTTPLPVDFPAGIEANTEGSTSKISVFLNEEETRTLLQEVPSAYNTQINDVLLTALVQTFAQWTGSRDLLIELEGHGREELFDDVDLSRTVGWFTTTFPVLLQFGEADEAGVALKSIKEQLRGIPKRGIGYGILRYLSQNTDQGKQLCGITTPSVCFNYLGQFDQVRAEPISLGFAQENPGRVFSPLAKRCYLLDVTGQVVEGKLQMIWIYSENVHRRSTISRLATKYNSALKALIAHCTSPEAGGYTPTDFPLADLGQQELDELLDQID